MNIQFRLSAFTLLLLALLMFTGFSYASWSPIANVVAWTNYTVENFQPAALAPNSPIEIVVNTLNYSAYSNGNFNNWVVFNGFTNTIEASYMEGNAFNETNTVRLNTITQLIIWINDTSGIGSAANAVNQITLGFYGTGVNSMNGNTIGESSILSVAQSNSCLYDNGNIIFTYYQSFGCLTTLSSIGWSNTIAASVKGLASTSTNILVASGNIFDVNAIFQTSGFPISANTPGNTLDALVNYTGEPTGGSGVAVGVSATNAIGGSFNTANCQYCLTSGSGGSSSTLRADIQGVQFSTGFSYAHIPTVYSYSIFNAITVNTLVSYISKGTFISNNAVSGKALELRTSNTLSSSLYWIRTRPNPPNNVLPSIAVQTVGTIPALAAGAPTPASKIIVLGQSIQFNSAASGGLTPYTYKWYQYSTSPGTATCTSANIIASATSSFYIKTPLNIGNRWFTYQVTDSENPINSVCSSAIELTTNTPETITIAASNVFVDLGQYVTITGSAPVAINNFNTMVYNYSNQGQQGSNITIFSGGTNSITFKPQAPQQVILPSGLNIGNYIRILITNYQNVSSVPGYQYPLRINVTNVSAYTNNNMQNIGFFYKNGTQIPSWFAGHSANVLNLTNLNLGNDTFILNMTKVLPATNWTQANTTFLADTNHPSCSAPDGQVADPNAPHGLIISTTAGGEPFKNDLLQPWILSYLTADHRACGIQLTFAWNTIEPNNGIFNFTPISNRCTIFTTNGIKCVISVFAVSYANNQSVTPWWVQSQVTMNPSCGSGAAGGNGQAVPSYYQPGFYLPWWSFNQNLTAWVAQNTLMAGNVFYLKSGIGIGEEDFPFDQGSPNCLAEWTANGFTYNKFTAYSQNTVREWGNFSKAYDVPWLAEVNSGQGGTGYNNTLPDAVATIAVNSSVGVGNEGLDFVHNIQPYFQGSAAESDIPGLSGLFYGEVPFQYQFRSPTVGSGGVNNNGAYLGNTISFAIVYAHAQLIEVPIEEWLTADNSMYTNAMATCPTYGSVSGTCYQTFNAILNASANVLGWNTGSSTQSTNTLFLPINTSRVIYMEFAPKTTVLMNGVTDGEASYLNSCNDDNGANIFLTYNSFCKTSSLPSGWTSTGGLTIGNTLTYMTIQTQVNGVRNSIYESAPISVNQGSGNTIYSIIQMVAGGKASNPFGTQLGLYSSTSGSSGQCMGAIGINGLGDKFESCVQGTTNVLSTKALYTNALFGISVDNFGIRNSHPTNITYTLNFTNKIISNSFIGTHGASFLELGTTNIIATNLYDIMTAYSSPGDVPPSARMGTVITSSTSANGLNTQFLSIPYIWSYELLGTDTGASGTTSYIINSSAVSIELSKVPAGAAMKASNVPVLQNAYETLTANLTGGTDPYTYNFLVYNAIGDLVFNQLNKNVYYANSTTFQINQAWGYGLFTWNVIITDNATVPMSVSNTLTFHVDPAPPVITISAPSNAFVDAGQYQTFTATIAGGTAPFTYNFILSNSITNTFITNGLFSGIMVHTYTFTYQTQAVNVGNSVYANVFMTDSNIIAPITVNSIYSSAYIENAMLTASAITASNSVIDAGQYSTLSHHDAGGTLPHTFKWYSYSTNPGSIGCDPANAVGVTTGTYTVNPSTTTWYGVNITDSASAQASACSPAFELIVNPAQSTPTLSASSTPTVQIGTTETFTATASGGTAPYTYNYIIHSGIFTDVYATCVTFGSTGNGCLSGANTLANFANGVVINDAHIFVAPATSNFNLYYLTSGSSPAQNPTTINSEITYFNNNGIPVLLGLFGASDGNVVYHPLMNSIVENTNDGNAEIANIITALKGTNSNLQTEGYCGVEVDYEEDNPGDSDMAANYIHWLGNLANSMASNGICNGNPVMEVVVQPFAIRQTTAWSPNGIAIAKALQTLPVTGRIVQTFNVSLNNMCSPTGNFQCPGNTYYTSNGIANSMLIDSFDLTTPWYNYLSQIANAVNVGVGIGSYGNFNANALWYNTLANALTNRQLTTVGNALYTGVSSTTNSFGWLVPSSDVGNVIFANVSVIDSPTTPTTVNSVKTASITIQSGYTAPTITISAPSNVLADVGQYECFTATVSNGASPFTYSFNAFSGATITNSMSFSSVSASTQKWCYYLTSTDQTHSPIQANVILTDSNPTTVNSVPSSAYTINTMLSAGLLTETNTIINSGQYSRIAGTTSGGTLPVVISYFSQANCAGSSIGSGASLLVNPTSTTTYSFNAVDSGTTNAIVCSVSNTVSVNGALNAGAITASNTALDNGQYTTLTANPSGGSTPYTFQWYTGAACTSAIGGATLQTYTINPGSTTTYYYKVTDNIGATACSAGYVITVNSIMTTPTLVASNTPSVNAGGYETFSAYVSQGTPPYTYNFKIYNSITKILVKSSSQSSNSFTWQVNGNSGNTLNANVFVTDAATTTETVNSVLTPTITVQSGLNPSLSAPQPGVIQYGSITITSSISGGVSPYVYNWFVQDPNVGGYYKIAGATSSSYTWSNTIILGTWQFIVQVKDSSGTIANSPILTLTVSNSPIFTLPINGFMAYGQPYTITAQANPSTDTANVYITQLGEAQGNPLVSQNGIISYTLCSGSNYCPPIGQYIVNVIDSTSGADPSGNLLVLAPVYIKNTTTVTNIITYAPYPACTNNMLSGNCIGNVVYTSSETLTNTLIVRGNVTVNTGVTLTTNGFAIAVSGTFNSILGTIAGGTIGNAGSTNGGAGGSFTSSYAGSGGGGGGANSGACGGANGGNGGNTIANGGLGGSPGGNGAAGTLPAPPALSGNLLYQWYINGIGNYISGAGGGNAGTDPGQCAAQILAGSGTYGIYIQGSNVILGAVTTNGVSAASVISPNPGDGGGAAGLQIYAYNNTYHAGTYEYAGGTGSSGAGAAEGNGANGANGNFMVFKYSYTPIPIFIINTYYPYKLIANSTNPTTYFTVNQIHNGTMTTVVSHNSTLDYQPNAGQGAGLYLYNITEQQYANTVSIYANITVNMTDIASSLTFNTPNIQYLPNFVFTPTFSTNPNSWCIKSDNPLNQQTNTVTGCQWSNANVIFTPSFILTYNNFTPFTTNLLNNPDISAITQTVFKVLGSNTVPSAPYTRIIINLSSFNQRAFNSIIANTTLGFTINVNNYSFSKAAQWSANTFKVYVPLSGYQNPTINISSSILTTISSGYDSEPNNFCPISLGNGQTQIWNTYSPDATSNTTSYAFTVYQGAQYAPSGYYIIVNEQNPKNGTLTQIESFRMPGDSGFSLPLLNTVPYSFSITNCKQIVSTTGLAIQTSPITIQIPLNLTIPYYPNPKPNVSCYTSFNGIANEIQVNCQGYDKQTPANGWKIVVLNITSILNTSTTIGTFNLTGNSFKWQYLLNRPGTSYHIQIFEKIGSTIDPIILVFNYFPETFTTAAQQNPAYGLIAIMIIGFMSFLGVQNKSSLLLMTVIGIFLTIATFTWYVPSYSFYGILVAVVVLLFIFTSDRQ